MNNMDRFYDLVTSFRHIILDLMIREKRKKDNAQDSHTKSVYAGRLDILNELLHMSIDLEYESGGRLADGFGLDEKV
jgi:hypothetical protein